MTFGAALRAPFDETLEAFYQLLQHERILQFAERAQQLHGAGLTAMAMHEPKLLSDEQDRLRDDLGMNPSIEETAARARAMIADLAKIDAAGLGGLDAPSEVPNG